MSVKFREDFVRRDLLPSGKVGLYSVQLHTLKQLIPFLSDTERFCSCYRSTETTSPSQLRDLLLRIRTLLRVLRSPKK
ncbi:hypothetical protein PoB_002595400 [Plakobranchus ocellatus]|uniref:Uncharacterized protein n=1 Tax=Plakobranchus ocellatus TaxID=259542 RepID=A0AAV3ZVW3_9GAST|nr:hypothetical protein PoB_002595400 [Plakobranchus ocellatus]